MNCETLTRWNVFDDVLILFGKYLFVNDSGLQNL